MTTTGFTPLDLEKPALTTASPNDDYIALLWGGHGAVSSFRRFLTPEERLVRSVTRGGFPLLRRESCTPRFTTVMAGGAIRPRM